MTTPVPTPAFYLQIEGQCGVVETILGVVNNKGIQRIIPIGLRQLSGNSEEVTADQIREALELDQWSIRHPDVFYEGKVVKDEFFPAG